MNSALTQFIALAALLVFPSAAIEPPHYEGCYSSSDSLQYVGKTVFQSHAYCVEQCSIKRNAVAALTDGDACWCGDSLPPKSSLLDDNKCDVSCGGYPLEFCGGVNTFSIYLTGIGELNNTSSSSSAPSSTPSSSPSASTSEASSTSLVSSTSTLAVSPTATPLSTGGSNSTITQTATPSTTSPIPTTQPNAAVNNEAFSASAMIGFIWFAIAAFL